MSTVSEERRQKLITSRDKPLRFVKEQADNWLRENGYDFKESLLNQMKIISDHRNKAVHGSIWTLTRDETKGVISFTRDMPAAKSFLKWICP